MKSNRARVRFGLVAGQQNNCDSPDSFIGLGSHGESTCGYNFSPNAAGNLGQCGANYGNKNARAMAYILVR